jgi:hypothetical protein
MEWWAWALIGWVATSIVGGILASRWFRWLRDPAPSFEDPADVLVQQSEAREEVEPGVPPCSGSTRSVKCCVTVRRS